MIELTLKTKYSVDFTTKFKNQLKKFIKQGKDISKLLEVVEQLANKEKLSFKYKDHVLMTDKNCRECHIEPDWLLIYQYHDEKIILLLIATGSHSDLF